MAVAFATLHVSCTAAPLPSLTREKKAPQLQHVNAQAIPHMDPDEIRMKLYNSRFAQILRRVNNDGRVSGTEEVRQGRDPADEQCTRR
jgi:hypothetical protein